MNFPKIMIALLVLIGSVITAKAETLVTDLSQHVIEITSQFAGSELLLFGAIERHATESIQTDEIAVQGLDYDIVVVVQSEPTDLVVRKKEKIGGIWINNENQTIRNIPGYYVLGSTRPVDEFLSPEIQKELGLGLDNLTFANDDNEEFPEYKEALIRNMKNRGLYMETSGNVTVKNEILFRANLAFPSNMPVGNYKTDVYLVRDGRVIVHVPSIRALSVDKIGLERVIYNFAHEYPPFYGMMAIIVAITVGLLSGIVARKVT